MKKINKKYTIIGAIVLIVVIIIIASSGKGDAAFESAPVAMADVIQDVDVTGKIAPEQKADLAFEKTGVVSLVSVKVGDKVVRGQVLGSLDTREARASYQAAQANVLSEKAKLDESRKGTRGEELTISGQTYSNAVRTFNNIMRDTFAQIDNTLRSNSDSMFNNADSSYPTLKVTVSTDARKKELESLRLMITEAITDWNKNYTNANVDQSSALTRSTLTLTKDFLTKLQNYIKDPTDADREVILTTIKAVTTINTNFIDAQASYDNAKGEYVLKRAGNTNESIESQQAKYEQAVAQAASEAAALEKMTITAPFDGIVTLVEPTLGETMSANVTAFTVMTADQYKIEVYVPESNISKINLGNLAKVTLDAYGKDTFFDASVSRIDPAETIVEGIPTYKVTLTIAPDPRIRSGMTADINIITAQKFNILSIPTRAIIEKDGQVFVRKVNGEKYTEVPVVIGLRGSNGNTELLSGLAAGDIVVTKVK